MSQPKLTYRVTGMDPDNSAEAWSRHRDVVAAYREQRRMLNSGSRPCKVQQLIDGAWQDVPSVTQPR